MITQIYKNNNPTNVKRANLPPSLDTLAQLPTKSKKGGLNTLQKRARSKWFTSQIVTPLILHTQYIEKDEKFRKYFSSAFYCSHVLTQENKRVKTKYCNTRVCNQCNRIRTAKLINGYISQLSGKKLFFVTLTIPNVNKSDLKTSISKMIKDCSNIIRVIRERKKININGIRKIEVTYNKNTNEYHPHIHLLVDVCPELIVQEWLKRNKFSKPIAQDIREANQNSLNELFKYTTKIAVTKNTKESNKIKLEVEALYNIVKALDKKRAFQPFGNIKKVTEDIKEEELKGEEHKELPDYDFCEWIWIESDWINSEGETLTNYKPPNIVFV